MEHAEPAQFATTPKLPFGRWLIEQEARGGAIGELAKSAKGDPQFPRNGDPKAVWKRLNAVQVDPDLYATIEEAELDWLAL